MTPKDIIRELLLKTGMTARGLARELKFPENAISYYINGKRKPNILNCYRIMRFAKKYDMKIKLEDLYPE